MNNPLISPGIGVIFWMAISFGILVFILAKFGWPMMLKMLKKREEDIASALNAAEKAREEMERIRFDNQSVLQEAKRERDEILQNARQTSEKIIEDAKAKAQEESDRIVESAREKINYEKLKAVHDLKNQIANLSIEIAEKLINDELSDRTKATNLVDKELEKANLN